MLDCLENMWEVQRKDPGGEDPGEIRIYVKIIQEYDNNEFEIIFLIPGIQQFINFAFQNTFFTVSLNVDIH